jgi:hypothetical protein
MEADWEVEIGPDTPVIDALWPGFIDLRRTPERIGEIDETGKFPALAEVLLRLNRSESNPGLSSDSSMDSMLDDVSSQLQVWSSKCDLWTQDRSSDSWDPDEMDATPAESVVALACYIDLLIRRAFTEDGEVFGITAYTTACGADSAAAEEALSNALRVLENAIGRATLHVVQPL